MVDKKLKEKIEKESLKEATKERICYRVILREKGKLGKKPDARTCFHYRNLSEGREACSLPYSVANCEYISKETVMRKRKDLN